MNSVKTYPENIPAKYEEKEKNPESVEGVYSSRIDSLLSNDQNHSQNAEQEDRRKIAASLPHIREEIVQACFRSIYKNKKKIKIDSQNARYVMEIAECLQHDGLKKKCMGKLLKMVENPTVLPNFFKNPPKNLTLKGGGPKAIAYGGALLALEKMGWLDNLVRYAGTSAGSIAALLGALKYSAKEIRQFLTDDNLYKSFASDPVSKIRLEDIVALKKAYEEGNYAGITKILTEVDKQKANLLGAFLCLMGVPIDASIFGKALCNRAIDAFNILKKGGICDGEGLRNWLKEKIEQKTGKADCTSAELHKMAMDPDKNFGELYVFAISMEDCQLKVFSHREELYKDVPLYEAVYASCAFPGGFVPQLIQVKQKNGELKNLGYFFDGGPNFNNPLEYFDNPPFIKETEAFNKETIGLSLCSPEKFEKRSLGQLSSQKMSGKHDLITVMTSLASAADNTQETNLDMRKINRFRQIELSNQNVDLIDIPPENDKKEALLRGGEEMTKAFAIDMRIRVIKEKLNRRTYTWPENKKMVKQILAIEKKIKYLDLKQPETQLFWADRGMQNEIDSLKVKIIQKTGGIKNRKKGPGVAINKLLKDRSAYNGGLWNNLPHGKGMAVFRDGSSYEGDWKNGKMHGKGRIVFPNGDFYEGDWKENKKDGKGKSQSFGELYEGDWKDNLKHGKGISKSRAGGGTYEGDWKDNFRHGKGKFTSHIIMSTTGWISNLKDGKSEFSAYIGVYEGDWKDDVRHGIGKSTSRMGLSHEGGWENGKQHGKGLITFPDGSSAERVWLNGKILPEPLPS